MTNYADVFENELAAQLAEAPATTIAVLGRAYINAATARRGAMALAEDAPPEAFAVLDEQVTAAGDHMNAAVDAIVTASVVNEHDYAVQVAARVFLAAQ